MFKSSLEKVMKFSNSGSLTSLLRHLGLWEAKYLSQKGFRKRPLRSTVVLIHVPEKSIIANSYKDAWLPPAPPG